MGTIRIVFFIFLCGAPLASAQEEEVITWSSKHRLSWEDFKGKPTNDESAATTASGISYEFSSSISGNSATIDYTVVAQFYPNKSWYRSELCNAHVLGHEQLHFDIAEVFADKMRRRMASTKFTENVKEEVAEIYDEINVSLYAFQHRYDNETNYSRNNGQQAIWNQKIEKLLGDD